MSSSLPRGIQLIQWKNKDKTKSVKYRVRITRNDFKANVAFNTIEEAKEYLMASKSKEGVKGLQEREAEEKAKIYQLVVADFLNRVGLDHFTRLYIKNYVDCVVIDTPMKKGNLARTKNILKTFTETLITVNTPMEKNGKVIGWYEKETRLGEFKIHEITHNILDDYIRARLSTIKQHSETELIKKSSVIAELSVVKKMFSKLKKMDSERFNDFEYKKPFENIDRELLANYKTKREFIIEGDDKQKLLEVINKYPNPEMRWIVLLSLYTGMRNSEVLTLKCNQLKLDKNYVDLIITKSKKSRKVFLTQQARDLIAEFNIKDFNSDKPIFKYKKGGFEGSFREMRRLNGLDHIKFHDLRRTMITNFLTKIGAEHSVLASEILGITNVDNMVQKYSTHTVKLETQKDLQATVGHSDDKTTKIYTNIT